MTKKNFIALADVIREQNQYAKNPHNQGVHAFTTDQLAALAMFCKLQNSNFNTERWLNYIAGECGPNGGAVKKSVVDTNGGFVPGTFEDSALAKVAWNPREKK